MIDFRVSVLTIIPYRTGESWWEMRPPQEPDRRQLATYYALAQVGIEMVLPIAIGWWADAKFGSAPWLLVIGVLLGFVMGIWHLVALTRNNDSTPPKDKRP